MILKRIEMNDEVKMVIDSSTILSSTYNKNTNDLVIIFKTGAKYCYKNVNISDYTRFELSESHGKAFAKYIKPYPYEKLPQISSDDINKTIDDIKVDVELYILDMMKSFIDEVSINNNRFTNHSITILDNIFVEVERYKAIK
jgi:hypothetical protein